jgi:hypothetical protein
VAKTQLGEKLAQMSFEEATDFVRNGVVGTFGFVPRTIRNSIDDLLDKFSDDYKKCANERDAALMENERLRQLLDELKTK